MTMLQISNLYHALRHQKGGYPTRVRNYEPVAIDDRGAVPCSGFPDDGPTEIVHAISILF